jgi:hypothetical protein
MRLLIRVKNLFLSPATEWSAIASEHPRAARTILSYALPLAALSAIAIIAACLVAVSGIVAGVTLALANMIATISGVLVGAFAVDAFAGLFESEKNFDRATQLVAYAFTPVWLAGLLRLTPVAGWAGPCIAAYGVYLLSKGMPHVMRTPPGKTIVYAILIAAIVLVTNRALGYGFTVLLGPIFGFAIVSLF